MGSRNIPELLERLEVTISALRRDALAFEMAHARALGEVEPSHRPSARNLLHYLSLRQQDLRSLQDELSSLGLSSLGRLEAHAMATLTSVLSTLRALGGRPAAAIGEEDVPVDFWSGPGRLAEHTRRLLGPDPANRQVRVMVTVPSEAADNPLLVRELVRAGMDVMRINCAHDDPSAWMRMVENLRRAERELGRACRILVDLAGPKLRTGPLAAIEHVVKLKPRRDGRGAAIPARIWMTPAEAPEPTPAGADGVLPVEGALLERARPGDVIDLEDSRGRERALAIAESAGRSCWAIVDQTIQLAEGAEVCLRRDDRRVATGCIGPLPASPLPIVLHRGDTLIMTRSGKPGGPATRNQAGEVVRAARIPCSLGEVFDFVRAGDRVWFDDGKISGVVKANDGREIAVEIIFAGPKGSRLRPEKGINLPDTDIVIPALTDKDVADLTSMVGVVDLVGLSFVRRPEDIYLLEDHLTRLDAQHLGIVLKIENRFAFDHLPQLLLAALRSPPVGVMVARGDLAVEVGFDRLAEVQEEILWLCEAAHVPVIWATQVLEEMARTGMPSRAEVTDAAMSGRAECVMLNKGPYIVEAVDFLGEVLERMDAHQSKKTAMLRKLAVSRMA
ncbi:pyruvate kinase [Shumkonia mesophila]|uniref:pyruvate kinase n=1 Tax=Shumkonia mesophila TaxID=2838854 RepID=UPI0029348A66|nr:pyruvate kinase [Shumkonia mesophila]